MTRTPQDDDALARLRAADPAPPGKLDASRRDELRDRAIRLGKRPGPDRGLRARWAGRRRPALRIGALAAALVAISATAIAVLIGLDSPREPDRPAFAAAAVRVAEANPRLLVTESGWSVSYANLIFGPAHGEMYFSDGENELELNWTPAKDYRLFMRDRTNGSAEAEEISLLGRRATLFRYGGTEFTTILRPQGEVFVEVRGDLGSRARYLEVLRSLERTDVDTWLAALPPDVVQPGERASAVDEMLEGIPLPPGFDPEDLEAGGPGNVSDRYQLAAHVTQAVICGWLDRWTEAKTTGDGDAEQEAVEAISSSKDWPVLQEIATEGGWSQSVWETADWVAAGGELPPDVYDQTMNCIEFR